MKLEKLLDNVLNASNWLKSPEKQDSRIKSANSKKFSEEDKENQLDSLPDHEV